MRIALSLILVLSAGIALAQQVYIGDGTTFALDPVAGGAVLVNTGDPADEITIAADCAADHPQHGPGDWAWDGAALTITFSDRTLHLDGPAPLDAPACGT